MEAILTIFVSVLRSVLILLKPGGHKRLVSENLILRQQLIVVSRKHSRSPPLRPIDRIVFAISSCFIPFKKLSIIAVIIKPAPILRCHRSLVNKKYQILFGSTGAVKRGRKGFDIEVINLVLEIKDKNPRYGCPRIAMLVSNVTGISIRRILRKHFKPGPGDGCRSSYR